MLIKKREKDSLNDAVEVTEYLQDFCLHKSISRHLLQFNSCKRKHLHSEQC